MNHKKSVNELGGGDKFFSAIGRFIYEFSNLEFDLKHRIADAIGLKDQYFDPIMTHDFALLCTIAQTVLIPSATNDQATKLKALISKCRSMNDDRIRIAHGFWLIGTKGSGQLHHVSRQKLEPTFHFSDPEGLAAKADLAASLRHELWLIFRNEV
jgi:hypothetical protein